MRLRKKLATDASRSIGSFLRLASLERAHVGVSDCFVALDRKEQRHIDIDALDEQGLDSGHALRRAGDLDE